MVVLDGGPPSWAWADSRLIFNVHSSFIASAGTVRVLAVGNINSFTGIFFNLGYANKIHSAFSIFSHSSFS